VSRRGFDWRISSGATLRTGLFVLAAAFAGLSHAARHSVAPGESIAAAIRAARPGDVIQVERGQYGERLLIDKPIALIGVNRPTLSAQGQGDVIRVRAPDVRIEGFIVRDSGADLTEQNAGIFVEPGADRLIVCNNQLVYNLFGVWLNGVKDVQILDNVITGKRDLASAQRGNGIQLYNSTGAQVIGNNISFTRDGMYVDISHHSVFRDNRLHHTRYGAHYMNSNDNTWENNFSYFNRGGLALMQVRNQVVRGNRAWGNSDHGIMLRSIQDSVVENNVVSGNNRGLFVYDAEYNVVKGNLVVANRVGVHVSAGSIHNQVEGNDFINNQEQVRFVAVRDEEWGKEVGNYWSNYRGWDSAGDGIGDVPYEANDLVDRLTWQHPLVKLLLNSPAVQTLRLLAKQFPMLRSPSVVDKHPRMRPFHDDWSPWFDEQRY
jgi:nitrous oxidase accessory protein